MALWFLLRCACNLEVHAGARSRATRQENPCLFWAVSLFMLSRFLVYLEQFPCLFWVISLFISSRFLVYVEPKPFMFILISPPSQISGRRRPFGCVCLKCRPPAYLQCCRIYPSQISGSTSSVVMSFSDNDTWCVSEVPTRIWSRSDINSLNMCHLQTMFATHMFAFSLPNFSLVALFLSELSFH